MSVLVIPMVVDGLREATDRHGVLGPLADFSGLPWTRTGADAADVNPDTAFTSQNVRAVPFADAGSTLERGIHLHWTLPDAFTRGRHPLGTDGTPDPSSTVFPPVPTSWLIHRRNPAGPSRTWRVESDYLWPPDTPHHPGRATYLTAARGGDGLLDATQPPFRLLGRSWDVATGPPADPEPTYLPRLVGVGYGEPTFAAFYPGCRDVFGLHDPCDDAPGIVDGSPPEGLTYEIFGWYPDVTRDLLRAADGAADAAHTLGWRWDTTEDAAPDRLLCHGRLQFSPTAEDPPAPDASQPIRITLANTGTEALAAHLAQVPGAGAVNADQREQQLQALLLSDTLRTQYLDLAPKLTEARHTATFRGVTGGTVWTLVDAEGGQQVATAPADVGAALHRLNDIQRRLDHDDRTIVSLRRQIFAEWHRYITCCYHPSDEQGRGYPAIDAVRGHIDGLLDELDEKVAAVEVLRDSLPAAKKDVVTLLGDESVTLAAKPAPHFFQPRDPVLLLAGQGVRPRDHTPGATLECHVVAGTDPVPGLAVGTAETITTLRDALADVPTQQTAGGGWDPMFIEWAASIHPREGVVSPGARSYPTDLIRTQYRLREDHSEFLSIAPDADGTERSTSYITGRSVLSPHAGDLLQRRIDAYLAHVVCDYLRSDAAPATPAAARPADEAGRVAYFDRHETAILKWLDGRAHDGVPAPIHTVLAARTALAVVSGAVQSQALGGFHEALLMQEEVLQLDPVDPLGFADYRTFTEQHVWEAVQGHAHTAPMPHWDFHPIRTGELELEGVRLVDRFGRTADLPTGFQTSRQLRHHHENRAVLPPRISQPARVHLSWRSAADDEVLANRHPLTSPVCGWLVPGSLDGNVLVYDAAGGLLGSVESDGRWRRAPGRPGPTFSAEIDQPHLRRVVGWLERRGRRTATFIDSFVDVLDAALEQIDPAGYQEHDARALLMGRPLAVVRVAVGLELHGRPASDQSWAGLDQELAGNPAPTAGFTEVQLPIRVGEHGRLGDGVAGYWVDGDPGARFHAPQSEWLTPDQAADQLAIDHAGGQPLTIWRSLADPALGLTVLLDPRGSLHCTTGVLPTTRLDLPPEHFAETLASLRVTFLAAPLLTPPGRTEIPLPVEPGFAWSWVQRDGDRWTERTTEPRIERAAFVAATPDGVALWDRLVDCGWLRPHDKATATPVARDRRPPLPDDLKPRAEELARLLDVLAHMLRPPPARAGFGQAMEIREGWLQLGPTDQT